MSHDPAANRQPEGRRPYRFVTEIGALVCFWILLALAATMLAGLAFAIGASRGADLVRQQAVDEGFAVRDPEFRWRTSEELVRKPASKSSREK